MVGIELRQQLKQQLQLIMTPQLQQAIKLLQLSRMELAELIREELNENPVLEDLQDGDETGGKEEKSDEEKVGVKDIEAVLAEMGQGSDSSRDAESSSMPSEPETVEGAKEVDWERYLENYANQAPAPRSGITENSEYPSFEASLTRPETLVEHLLWQIRLANFTEAEEKLATLILGNLDADGYFKEPPLEYLAQEACIELEDAEEVLKDIQVLDPVGVAARDLRECLLIQCTQYGLDDLTCKIVDRHMHNLEKHNYQAIARDLGIPVEQVYTSAKIISGLEPRPARNFITEDPRYITPDVYVTRIGDEYYVTPNDDGMPRLKISNFYRKAIRSGDSGAKEYVQSKMRSAQWLIRSIEQRRRTIVRVTECIVEKQRDFFDRGIDYLKPMILRDVAEAVELHESTVSRVTTNKYVHTPQGLFELKYFFNSSIRRTSNEDIASQSVKNHIKQIISEENNKKPLSDQAIVRELEDRGIVIARRTVAKYREMLGILPSSKRKRFF